MQHQPVQWPNHRTLVEVTRYRFLDCQILQPHTSSSIALSHSFQPDSSASVQQPIVSASRPQPPFNLLNFPFFHDNLYPRTNLACAPSLYARQNSSQELSAAGYRIHPGPARMHALISHQPQKIPQSYVPNIAGGETLNITKVVLAGSLALSLVTILAAPASAQPGQSSSSTQATSPATTPTPATPDKLSTSDQVTVTAEGETRDVQSIDQKLLLESTPGTSPIAILGHLPSVSITTADPYGAYEWAVRISVRGFNQNQLGFTLDDVPLGDMSYGNLNGLHISRALIDENLGHASLSQGTGALDTASTSNLGGAVQFFSTDPDDKRSFRAQQSFGSFNGSRTFARFDSGLLPSHTKLFVDGVYQTSDKWRGDGPIRQSYFQFNTKLQQFIGSKGVLTVYADYSNRQEVDYQDDNTVWVNKLGYKWDNFGNWQTALQAANAYNAQGGGGYVFKSLPTVFPNPVASLQTGFGDLSNDPEDAGYYAAGGLRKDFLGYVNYKTAITSHLTSKTTIYGHHNNGAGLWWTPYVGTYDSLGTPRFAHLRAHLRVPYRPRRRPQRPFLRDRPQHPRRRRLVREGKLRPRPPLLRHHPQRSRPLRLRHPGLPLLDPVGLQLPHQPLPDPPAGSVQTLPGHHPLRRLQDQRDLHHRNPHRLQHRRQPGPTDSTANYAQGKLTSGKPFLPQVGVNWKLGQGNEVFADVAENVRAFQAGGKGFGTSPWGTTQAGFNALTTNLKSESSWSEEAGYRHTDNHLQAQASYFHVNFSNRLLAIQQGPGIAGNASILSNVGGVTTNGVDGAITNRLPGGWSFYNALTYSKSTYDSNYNANPTTIIQTAGKVVVDAPEFLYKNELSYSRKGFDATSAPTSWASATSPTPTTTA